MTRNYCEAERSAKVIEESAPENRGLLRTVKKLEDKYIIERLAGETSVFSGYHGNAIEIAKVSDEGIVNCYYDSENPSQALEAYKLKKFCKND